VIPTICLSVMCSQHPGWMHHHASSRYTSCQPARALHSSRHPEAVPACVEDCPAGWAPGAPALPLYLHAGPCSGDVRQGAIALGTHREGHLGALHPLAAQDTGAWCATACDCGPGGFPCRAGAPLQAGGLLPRLPWATSPFAPCILWTTSCPLVGNACAAVARPVALPCLGKATRVSFMSPSLPPAAAFPAWPAG
jgi:hypothetical protein